MIQMRWLSMEEKKQRLDGFVHYKHAPFSLHKTFINGLELCGLLVDYCDVFISCLGSHSDGTHSLQRIHCWASDVMLHFFQIFSNLFQWRNKLLYILDGLRVSTFSTNLIFWVNDSFKLCAVIDRCTWVADSCTDVLETICELQVKLCHLIP